MWPACGKGFLKELDNGERVELPHHLQDMNQNKMLYFQNPPSFKPLNNVDT